MTIPHFVKAQYPLPDHREGPGLGMAGLRSKSSIDPSTKGVITIMPITLPYTRPMTDSNGSNTHSISRLRST
jgi:hypothetical protein